MALRVTARFAQRLGTIAPNQILGVNRHDAVPSGTPETEMACIAKWLVLAIMLPAKTA